MHELNRLDVIARDDSTKANSIRQVLEFIQDVINILRTDQVIIINEADVSSLAFIQGTLPLVTDAISWMLEYFDLHLIIKLRLQPCK
jgi:hypothetical protein